MKPATALIVLALLCGCASTPQPGGTTATPELAARVVPGRTTKPELLAMLGKTHAVAFDSGYEAWLYDLPAGGGKYSEFVVLIDPQGVVKKTRQRAPALPGQ